MNVVIQCAGSKRENAPSLISPDGRKVKFVADPSAGTPPDGVLWARPDDDIPGQARTWRDELARLVASDEASRSLLPAWRLYKRDAYGQLVRALGQQRVFILSAGWGLVRADFPLPDYDITFLRDADAVHRRLRTHRFRDFMQLDMNSSGPVVFIGGKDYLPLFQALTESIPARKVVLYRVPPRPTPTACRTEGLWTYTPYPTNTCTNWHYGAAAAICRDAAAVVGQPRLGGIG